MTGIAKGWSHQVIASGTGSPSFCRRERGPRKRRPPSLPVPNGGRTRPPNGAPPQYPQLKCFVVWVGWMARAGRQVVVGEGLLADRGFVLPARRRGPLPTGATRPGSRRPGRRPATADRTWWCGSSGTTCTTTRARSPGRPPRPPRRSTQMKAPAREPAEPCHQWWRVETALGAFRSGLKGRRGGAAPEDARRRRTGAPGAAARPPRGSGRDPRGRDPDRPGPAPGVLRARARRGPRPGRRPDRPPPHTETTAHHLTWPRPRSSHRPPPHRPVRPPTPHAEATTTATARHQPTPPNGRDPEDPSPS